VYNLCVALGSETSPERIEGTMQDRLAEELVQEMIENEIDEEHLKQQSHVVLPSMSGVSTRLHVPLNSSTNSTAGTSDRPSGFRILAMTSAGSCFFDGDSRHYYPAHQIPGPITETPPTMSISNLFHSDPTRQLEEVQKVNARERAETDVAEFYETKSAERVLTELGDVIETHPGEAARFLYLHATFGSGKTHLLKLIGLVADTESEFLTWVPNSPNSGLGSTTSPSRSSRHTSSVSNQCS